MKHIIMFIGLFSAGVLLAEDSESESTGFGAWHISIGGAMNAGVKTRLSHRSLTLPQSYVSRFGTQSNAQRLEWGDGYVRDDAYGHGSSTINWKLPSSSYNGDGTFSMVNRYDEIVSTSLSRYDSGNPDADYQPGVSVELSRTLYADVKHGWGVDFAAAFSYFFGNDLYSANGGYSQTDMVNSGEYQTTVDAHQAMADYQDGIYTQTYPGYYGDGVMSGSGHPGILWNSVGTPVNVGPRTTPHTYMSSYSASGDYQEIEMLFMIKPWYELTDWCRVFGELGLGVSRSQFDFSYSAMGGTGAVRSSQDFSEWDVYGIGGGGVLFRLWRFDLSVDFLARFLKDDLDVNGRYVSGHIERADWLMRVMVGVEF